MEKKLTRRESRETAFLTAFAATFEPEEPTVPAEEHAAPDAFANQLLAAMNDHAAELDEIITAHLKGWTLSRVPRVSLVALRLALAEMLYGDEQKPVSPSTRLSSWSRNTVPRTTTSSSTACWVSLRVSAARPPNPNADAGHRHQQLRNLSGSV